MIEKLPELVNDDAVLLHRGRYLSVDFMIEVGERQYLVHVREGRIAGVDEGPFVMPSWTFAIRGPAEVWERFWEPVPAPGWNDLFALRKDGRMAMEGDLQPLMANLLYVKELIAAPRKLRADA
jgi:hypothetical protein